MSYLNTIGAAFRELSQAEKKVNWIKLKLVILGSRISAKIGNKSQGDYLEMQKRQYEAAAAVATVKDGKLHDDCVAAVNWDEQNSWSGYIENILKYAAPSAEKVALEYGCGPGRNILNWSKEFKRIDGVDISKVNLENVEKLADQNLATEKKPKLYLTQGQDCGDAPKNYYDFCFSVICFQHIASHSVRFSILTSLYEVLKPSGSIAFQMGYKALGGTNTVDYYENAFNAGVTNGACDVRVENPDNVKDDLKKIGFEDIEIKLVDVPDSISSVFEKFIFVQAKKG